MYGETVREVFGMQCPKCKKDTHLFVEISARAKLSADGTNIDGQDHFWQERSSCSCDSCGWMGIVKEARIK